MLIKIMKIEKHIEKKIEIDYFFIEGVVNIDVNYFLKKIENCVNFEENLNYKTSVKGKVTPFQYFRKDPMFLQLIDNFISYLDDNIDLTKYHLEEAWGFKVGNKEQTNFHKHLPAIWSGVIYLNDHEQILEFPEINKQIKPSVGKFVLFSSFLKHGCKKNNTDNFKYGLSFNMFISEIFKQ